MELELTQHAIDRLRKRKIEMEWLNQAVFDPDLVLPDPDDVTLEHRLAIIPNAGYKVLRVVCDSEISPTRIITAFFDPDMKGKL